VPGEVTGAALVRELAIEALAVRDRLATFEQRAAPWSTATLTGPSSEACPAWAPLSPASSSQRQATSPASGGPMRSPPLPASPPSPPVRTVHRPPASPGKRQGPQASPLYGRLLCRHRRHPISRAYYDRKRREGERHTQALIALARRQTTVLW
jgi:hypothetical protein